MAEKKYKKILVVGDAMLDEYHFGNVDRISPEAPVPVFLETGRVRCTAGGAANVAVNIAAIGIDTDFLSVVGSDENGKKLLALLRSQKVAVEKVIVSEERPTTCKIRFIGQNNQQVLRVDAEEAADISEEMVDVCIAQAEEQIEDYGLLLLSDYKKGLLTEEVTQKLIQLCVQHHIPVFADVKEKNYQKYRGATLLKPNRKELEWLSGRKTDTVENAIEAAKVLCREAKVSYVLATLGGDGMILVRDGEFVKRAESTASEVYDVTGAGDTSIAYLAASVVMGQPVEKAVTISNYAAGIQVSKAGTCVVSPGEVMRAMYMDDMAGSVSDKFVHIGGSIAGKSDMQGDKFESKLSNLHIGGSISSKTCDMQGNKSENRDGSKKLDFYRADGLETLEKLRAAGKKIVFTNGCFDILHSGHVSYLQAARSLGDILVVGVNSDESVRRLKGRERPVNSLHDRQQVLEALACVDYVIPFCEDTPADLIEKLVPDVLVKGGDYKPENIVGADVVKRNGGEVLVLPFVEGKSTTAVIERLKNKR